MEKKTLKKVLSIIGNVVIWLFVIFAIVVTMFTIAANSSKDGIPSIGDTTILTVASDSMEPTFYKGDVILGKKLSPDEQKTLKKGDIITFSMQVNDDDEVLNSHRIAKVIEENGKVSSYITQGDNEEKRAKAGFTTESVLPEDVVCKYTGTRIPFVGNILSFLQGRLGFLLCVVLPLIVLFIFEAFRFIKKYLELKGTGKISAEEEERIRQAAVEEYLRSKEGGNDAPSDEPADNAPEAGGEE